MSYTTADGTKLEATLEQASIHAGMSAHDVTLDGTFDDALGRTRYYQVSLHELSVSSQPSDLAGHGEVCFPRQSGGEDVCSDVGGTAEIRALSTDCTTHESGISACAETLDLTLQLVSEWQGTRFELDASELTRGEWVDTKCTD